MDLYQIFIKYNRTWAVREQVLFLILLTMIVIYTSKLLLKRSIVLSQAAAGLCLFLFLGIVFGSTVFTRVPTERQYRLELFWSWKKVFNGDSELLKENLLNCVLLILSLIHIYTC